MVCAWPNLMCGWESGRERVVEEGRNEGRRVESGMSMIVGSWNGQLYRRGEIQALWRVDSKVLYVDRGKPIGGV